MNRQQLYTFGSALLATTALASTAMAGTVGSAAGVNNVSSSALRINTLAFASTASTANSQTFGNTQFAVSFSNTFTKTTKFGVEIDITGAQFVVSPAPTVTILTRSTSFAASFLGTLDAIGGSMNCNLTAVVDSIIIDNCQLTGGLTTTGIGGVGLSGILFQNGSALATAGNSVALSYKVYNANNTLQNFETVSASNIITSTVPISAVAVAANSYTVDPLTTPTAFTSLSAPTAGSLSVTLALVYLTLNNVSTKGTDLVVNLTAGSFATNGGVVSASVTLTSAALSSAAVSSITFFANGVATSQGVTPAAFSSGTATFNVANASSAVGTFMITAQFDGKTAIPAVASNSAGMSATWTAASPQQAIAAVTGPTTAISRGGFSGEANTVLGSSNATFLSFIRIHNNGPTAGTVTISVKNDATGAAMGAAYTSNTIASGQTLQISAKDIETGAGITAAAGQNYTVNVSGPIIGYIQHIIFNPATGQFGDLSSFRNAGVTTNNP